MSPRFRFTTLIACILAACQQPTPGVPGKTDTVRVVDTVGVTQDSALLADRNALIKTRDSLLARPVRVDTVVSVVTHTVTVIDSALARTWQHAFTEEQTQLAALQSKYDALESAPRAVDTVRVVTDTALAATYASLQSQYAILHTRFDSLVAHPTIVIDTVRVAVTPPVDTTQAPLPPGEYAGVLCDSIVVVHRTATGGYYTLHTMGLPAGVVDTNYISPTILSATINRPTAFAAVVVQGPNPERMQIAYLPGDTEVLKNACYNGPVTSFSWLRTRPGAGSPSQPFGSAALLSPTRLARGFTSHPH